MSDSEKVAIVTGSASGIGAACSKLLQDKGYRVYGLDIQDKVDHFKIDISNESEVSSFIDKLKEEGIEVSCLVNSAAIQIEKPFLDTTPEEWESVFNINVKSIFLLSKALMPLFNKSASIINISSVHSRCTSVGMTSYVSSKGAVSALTRAMALELAENGIRVNSVAPGAIDTPMLRKGLGRNSSPETALEKIISSTPIKKIGTPEDVANLVYFLADSTLSGNITGQEFFTDGGVSAKLASE